MKIELLAPAATLVAALISSEGVRAGIRPSTKELLVKAYRELEAAAAQIEAEDLSAQNSNPAP